jgi:hypothetical protein
MDEVRFDRATESDATQLWEVRTAAIAVLCAEQTTTPPSLACGEPWYVKQSGHA